MSVGQDLYETKSSPHRERATVRSTAGLFDAPEWLELFGSYSDIVLVANSDAVNIEELRASVPNDALFVFFNKVYKVLDRPFDGNSILVARSGAMCANIVYRREVGTVTRNLRGAPGFHGILNLCAARHERFSPAKDFEGVPTGHLDLNGFFGDFYPRTHIPSSGFALAVWLHESLPGAGIVLAGFSARRSEEWKLFHVHDWTFEQIVQRLLVRSGRLDIRGQGLGASYAAITRRFQGVTVSDVALAASEVLSGRLEGANREIDKLISVTRVGRSIENFIRGFKPKSRRDKMAEREAREKSRR